MNKIISIPDKISIKLDSQNLEIEGPFGKNGFKIPADLNIHLNENQLVLSSIKGSKKAKALIKTFYSLILNNFTGVSVNYFRNYLKLVGVGFRANIENNYLILKLGFSHPVKVFIPDSLDVKCSKPTLITIKGCDLQEVNHFTSKIRELKKPEPYKGKGILYRTEQVTLKEGKKG